MLSGIHRAFLMRRRIGHLATADREGAPHCVPVCFALDADTLYMPVDDKPKRTRALKRLDNIAENPAVSFLCDHYDEDWSRLGWVRIDGCGEILRNNAECERALALLRERYAQYAAMRLAPVVALRILRVAAWGDLSR